MSSNSSSEKSGFCPQENQKIIETLRIFVRTQILSGHILVNYNLFI